MIVIYEVIHSVGSAEEKLHVIAEGSTESDAEAQAVAHYTSLGLVNANHYKLDENPELSYSPPDPGPTQLTKDPDGRWSETAH